MYSKLNPPMKGQVIHVDLKVSGKNGSVLVGYYMDGSDGCFCISDLPTGGRQKEYGWDLAITIRNAMPNEEIWIDFG